MGINDDFWRRPAWVGPLAYQGSRIAAPTRDDVDEQCGGHVDEWGDDEVSHRRLPPVLTAEDIELDGVEERRERRRARAMTEYERRVNDIAERYGLEYERPRGGRGHGRLRDPVTGYFRPVSGSPQEMGKALIHVQNDAKRLLRERPAEAVSTNGDGPAPCVVEPEPADPATEPIVASPARRTIRTRNHDDKRRRSALAEITRAAGELDQLRAWEVEKTAESDDLVAKAHALGLRYAAIAKAAGRSTSWVQMSLRRAAGVSTHPAEPIPGTARSKK